MPPRKTIFEKSRCAGTWPLLLLFALPPNAHGRQFTVRDDIRLTNIDEVMFSPDKRYFAVMSQRGRLDLDRPESCIRVYRSEIVGRILHSHLRTESPVWNLCRAAYGEGPNIQNVRWLKDSTGLAFLGKTASGTEQLFLAEVSSKRLESLTPSTQDVTGFDVRSRERFVYTALSPEIREASANHDKLAVIVGTGRALSSLMPSRANSAPDVWQNDLSELWVVSGSKRFRIEETLTRRAIPVHLEGERALSLSPDGRRIVTALTVRVVPKQWETLYPPPFVASPYRIRAREQNPNALAGQRDVSQYVLIDIADGRVEPLINAPIGNAAGWWGISRSDWSSDGNFVVLSNTFVPPSSSDAGSNAPCVAVQEVKTDQVTCLVRRSGDVTTNSPLVANVCFDSQDPRTVTVFYDGENSQTDAASFVRKLDGSWVQTTSRIADRWPYSVAVTQELNEPPLLLATDLRTTESRVLWAPNAWMNSVRLANVSPFTWRDKTGREWLGGLYKPPGYVPGMRYPLVIQTHGFDEHKFAPSGAFPTAFAAQELASAGIVVLQVRDCPIRGTSEEASCQIAGYEAAVEKLSADGLVDQTQIGIIGFSRTCYYVLAALTMGTVRFKAASVTDGVDEGYLQYMLGIDVGSDNAIAHEADAIVGARPFGQGLLKWFQRSPVFNMDQVNTPLQVVATPDGLLQMWEPYACLRYLNRPVDLLILNSNEHVLSKPSERLASQGFTVDWFRYWLQGYRDPDRTKSPQYERWDAMRTQMELPGRADTDSSTTSQ